MLLSTDAQNLVEDEKYTILRWTQETLSPQYPYTHWAQQRHEPITVNDIEKHAVWSISNLDLSSFFQEKDRDKSSDSDVSWHPQNVTCVCLHVHICVRVLACVCLCVHRDVCVCGLFIWWWITQLWGSRLTSFHPANSHWSLPPLSLNP